MTDHQQTTSDAAVDELYAEAVHWEVNTGDETIHAKRIPGKWRCIKWLSNATWLVFFLGPYLRWGDRQAVLFDIPNRQFHILGITILPQDFWMLSLLLLFFAILLAVVTALVGRVWCGFFCFQTVWTDVFTWVEERLEGAPQKRRKLDQAPWTASKIGIKTTKHAIWLAISFLTGVSFVAWFVDAYQLWLDLFSFSAGTVTVVTIALFVAGTYGLAGFLREQTCFWLCPYARIQGVMVDNTTAVPTYDFHRGEPRGRVKKGQKQEDRTNGDCVDCNLCIDACDTVMEKLHRPKNLIRYESLDMLNGKEGRPLFKRPRVWIYGAILALSLSGISYGLSSLDAIEIKVIHARQPLFVMQSDGSVQNRYTVKVLNKMTEDMDVTISATGPEGLVIIGADQPVSAGRGKVTPRTLFVRVPRQSLQQESEPIIFRGEAQDAEGMLFVTERESVFIGPDR